MSDNPLIDMIDEFAHEMLRTQGETMTIDEALLANDVLPRDFKEFGRWAARRSLNNAQAVGGENVLQDAGRLMQLMTFMGGMKLGRKRARQELVRDITKALRDKESAKGRPITDAAAFIEARFQ